MRTIYKYIFLIIALTFASRTNAQYINYEDDSGWKFGLNIGAAWQQDKALGIGKLNQADVFPRAGAGFGLTFGKAIFEREGRLLSLDLRFRYLRALTYGQDHTPNYDLANDPLYTNSGLTYTFNNYKMDLHQYDLEGVLTLNRLRERTGIILYGFGGIGFTNYRVKRNVFDENNQHYDFSNIDTTASRPNILSGLNSVMDNSYESEVNIEGGQGTQVKLMPSLGLGLGYQFTPRFAMGVEHKITYALNDNIDGIINGHNDRFHYTALILRWNLMRGRPYSHSSGQTKPRPVTQNPQPQPVVTAPPPTITPPPAPQPPPVVNVINPAQNGMAVHNSLFTVNAFVYNVAGKQNVTFKVNGVIYNGFNFNNNTGQLNSTITLQPGSNVIEVIGVNPVGIASDSRIIVYEFVNMSPPPVVTITNPTYSPHTTNINMFNVTATVLNVAGKNNIEFRVNGAVTTNFAYNTNTKVVGGLINLNEGLNTIEIRGTNNVGTDIKNTQIVYQKPVVALPPPVVTITVPGQEPFNTTQSVIAITASVQNVSTSSGIGVRVNGTSQTGFLFNPQTGVVSFNAYLVEGNNVVEVTGVNAIGTASATRTIIYKKPEVLPPPIVIITQPTFSPFVTNVSNATIKATILNIQSSANVTFRINGQSSANFSYNTISKEFTANVNLNQGNNTFEISGTNNMGIDSKITTIIYEKPVVIQPPVVNITTPQSSPFITQHVVEQVVAEVLNVNSAADINLLFNGIATNNFSYNITSKQLNFTANLIDGANVIQITATNQAGIASKSQTIIYNKPVLPCSVPVITITQPTSSPILTNNNKGAILAKITGAQSVSFKINGINSPGFNYNNASGQFESFLNLNVGATAYEIIATNECGSASQSIVYVYEILVPPCQPPVVNISNPIASGGVVAAPNFSFAANALNISAAANITLNHNGASIPFTFDANTGNIASTLTLLEGNNNIEVIASNDCGTATKNTSITYTKPVVISPPPVISYVTPSSYPHTTTNQNVTLTFKVLNITSQAQVGITKDGVVVTNFTYNNANKNVTLTTSLTPGAHTFVITATNPSGSASKTAEVIVQEPCTPPAVIINQPPSTPHSTQTPSYTVLATAQHVTQANQMTVNVNGVVFNGFTFNPNNGQISVPVSLINGLNLITIVATNNCGVAQKTAQIDFTGCDNPVIVFEGVPTRHEGLSANQFVFLGTALNATAITSVKVDGVATNNYVFNNVDKSFVVTIATKPNGNNTPYVIEVTAQNACGSTTSTYNATYVFLQEEVVIGVPQQPTPPAVTITYPASSPYTSTSQQFNFVATVNHVPSSQYISMKVNGLNFNNFLYEITTKQLTATINLSTGSNTVEVTATTPAGSDQKTAVIAYNPPAPPQIVPGPTVTITAPTANPHEATSSTQTVTAQVLHVASSAEIAMTVNGVGYNGFTYNMNTKALNTSLNLPNGLTVVEITASNANGTDQKSVQINYNPQPIVPVGGGCMPVVAANFTTNHMSVTVNSNKDLSNVVLKYFDGVEQKFDNLTGLTGTFSGNGNNQGKCIVGVWIKSGCNQSNDGPGYGEWVPNNAYNNECAAVPCVAPVINFGSPLTTTSSPYSISATVTNVTQNEIQLTVNGNATTFTYNTNNQTLTAQATLNVGNNTITIVANGCETISQSYTVAYSLPCSPITFSLTNPTNQTETVTNNTYSISLSAQNVTTGNITVKNNGNTVPFTFNNNVINANNITLAAGSNTIVVTLSNACSSETITYNVTYNEPVQACGPRINPGNAAWQFCLVTPSGTFTRNDLHGNTGFTYSGPASSVFFSAIAGGGNATVNGTPYTIQSGRYYLFSGNLTVSVSNNQPGAMGFWTVCVDADSAPQSGVGNNRPTSPCEANQGGGNNNPPTPPAPVVSITTPNVSPFVASQVSQNIEADVDHVASAAEITMTVNGTAFTNFNYNLNNKKLTASLNLSNGLTLVEITASNGNGTDQKSVQISYTPAGNQGGGNQGGGCMPTVSAVFHPSSLSLVANSTKDLSNVVLKYHDGVEQKFDNLSGLTGNFAGTGLNQGKCIIGVWIKSGCNMSNDGPGYGEWVPNTSYDNQCGGKQMQAPTNPNQGGGGIKIQPNQGGGNKGVGDRAPQNTGGGIQIQPNKGNASQPDRTPNNGIQIQPNTGNQQTRPAPQQQSSGIQIQPSTPQQQPGGVNVRPNPTQPTNPSSGGVNVRPNNTRPEQQSGGGVNVKPSTPAPARPQNTRPTPAPAAKPDVTPPAKEEKKEEPKEEVPRATPQVAPRGPR
ncbi:MAG: hypothetical protein ACK4K0_01720 [Flavobacteriales bacterium]